MFATALSAIVRMFFPQQNNCIHTTSMTLLLVYYNTTQVMVLSSAKHRVQNISCNVVLDG